MTIRCYPKYSYLISFTLSLVILLIPLFLFVWTNDSITVNAILCASLFLLFGGICFLVGLYYMQFCYFEDGYLIVRSAFGIITKVQTCDAVAYIETFPTYRSLGSNIDKRWICVYDKSIANDYRHKFRSGCANKRNAKKVQIIYTEGNIQFIEQYVKIGKRGAFLYE